MMLELLGSVIISQTPSGPPYYPSPDKPASEQGYSNCICGENPRGGEEIDYIEPYYGKRVRVKIYGMFLYAGSTNLVDNTTEHAPFGCREYYRRICDENIGYGEDWTYCLGLSQEVGAFTGEISHQPGCLNYTPLCPRVRIQGMPGQTIRVRCKSGEDGCTTDRPIPKR